MSTEVHKAISKEEAIHLKKSLADKVDLPEIKQNAIFAFLASRHVPPEVLCYILIFFVSMIFMELSLEAATKEFSDVDSLASAVTLFQFGFCLLLPLIISRGEGLKRFPRTIGGFVPYIRLSIVIFGATGFATQSVKYVSYPTKVVFKSAKLIPTMMVATVLQRKIYGRLEYAAAVMLCAGAAGYAYGSGSASGMQSNNWYGVVLLTISIFCDAIVPNLQKMLMSPHELPHELPHSKSKAAGLSATELMVNTNAVGFASVLCYMFMTNQLLPAVETALMRPRLILYLVLVGVGLSTAVLAYTKLIQTTDSVVAVTVATMRKVVTVILSFVVFPKPLLAVHVVSGMSLLGGIALGSFAKGRTR